MRRIILLVALFCLVGVSNPMQAQTYVTTAGVVYKTDGACQITSFNFATTLNGETWTMRYACSGRFYGSSARATVYFDRNYVPPSPTTVITAASIYGSVSQILGASYVGVGRSLCRRDYASGLDFCDESTTVTTAPSILSCLKDTRSGKSYCPSWTSIESYDPASGGVGAVMPVPVNPVGPPSTGGGTFTGIPASGSLASSISSPRAGTAVATIYWSTSTGEKSHRVVVGLPGVGAGQAGQGTP